MLKWANDVASLQHTNEAHGNGNICNDKIHNDDSGKGLITVHDSEKNKQGKDKMQEIQPEIHAHIQRPFVVFMTLWS